ncbi:MAG: hypothetical protein M3270_09585 [Thermoproteota archaeon]|nr:hypothetical protein [Thermoproteota archaeon]
MASQSIQVETPSVEEKCVAVNLLYPFRYVELDTIYQSQLKEKPSIQQIVKAIINLLMQNG